MKKYRKSHYWPENKDKFVGKYPIQCRSSWEAKFCRWCDLNESVIKWTSETVIIPYVSPIDMKYHRYYVDNAILFKDSEGNLVKYLIEIKPHSSTKPPIPNKRKKPETILFESMTYQINTAKWEAANKWCEEHGFIFKLLTEKELNI